MPAIGDIFGRVRQYFRCICVLQCCLRVQDDLHQDLGWDSSSGSSGTMTPVTAPGGDSKSKTGISATMVRVDTSPAGSDGASSTMSNSSTLNDSVDMFDSTITFHHERKQRERKDRRSRQCKEAGLPVIEEEGKALLLSINKPDRQ